MRETVQHKKEHLLSDLQEVWLRMLEAADALPLDKRDAAFLGEWDIRSLLAHLAGWDYTYILAVEQIQSGEVPEFYQHHSPDWRVYNAALVAQYRREDWGEMVESVRTAQRALLETINAVPPDELYKDRGIRFRGYRVTIARLLEAELKDVRTHLDQIQAFAAS